MQHRLVGDELCDERLVNREANHDGISSFAKLGVGGTGVAAEVAAGCNLAVLASSGGAR